MYVLQIFEKIIFTYAITITLSYLILALLSWIRIRQYVRSSALVDYKELLSSPFAPSISLIAPAYNEGCTIVDNVRSLMSLQYNNHNIIIVNDGSKDDTFHKMQEAFDLVKVPYFIDKQISTKPIRGVYKSSNRAFKRLLVVDKENGGKADALNAGLNISSHELIACIDVDCIIEPQALLKMAKPFLDDPSKKIIACGGVVRIANSCQIEGGRLVLPRFPDQWLVRFQVIEYLRAFLLGRMAWANLNGLLIISGAFGLFDREIAIKAGGYSTNTVGEDMELVVRMRAYMTKMQRPYKVEYVPEPLCWTEAPSSNTILGRQRNRWTRGTFEVLKLHKYMCFNPKYGVVGLLSYPFWMFFEWMAPIIEFIGWIYFGSLISTGNILWSNSLWLLLLVYVFAVFISVFSIMADEFSFRKYGNWSDLWKMLLTALIEPLVYHPKVVYWALKGNLDLILGKGGWGQMTRAGFATTKVNQRS